LSMDGTIHKNIPHEPRYTFKDVLIKVGIARILRDEHLEWQRVVGRC
jgi:hypothetical protein